MGTFREQALAEGVDMGDGKNALESEMVGDPAQKGVTEAPPASHTKVETPASPDGGVKPVVNAEDNVPFHKHPRWIKLQRELEAEKGERQRLNEQYQKMLERAAFLNPQSPQQQLDPQASQALRQLFTLAKSDPEVQKMLGLDGIAETKRELEAMKSQQLQSAFNGEFGQVVDDCVSKYGLTKDEFEAEFEEFLSSNDLIKTYTPGKSVLKKLANALLFDRQEELVERKLNAKVLKEKTDKKALNSEAPAKNAQTPGGLKGSPRERMEALISESGGIGF